MEDQTLMILGFPVTFSRSENQVHIEGCLKPGERHPGPCKGSGIGKAIKKIAAPKARKPRIIDDPESKAARGRTKRIPAGTSSAEIARTRDEHFEIPMDVVRRLMEDLGRAPGWSFDPQNMRTHYQGDMGTGSVELHPQGYLAQVDIGGKKSEQILRIQPDAVNWVLDRARSTGLGFPLPPGWVHKPGVGPVRQQ